MVNYVLKKIKNMASNYEQSYQSKFEFALHNFYKYQKETKIQPLKNKLHH